MQKFHGVHIYRSFWHLILSRMFATVFGFPETTHALNTVPIKRHILWTRWRATSFTGKNFAGAVGSKTSGIIQRIKHKDSTASNLGFGPLANEILNGVLLRTVNRDAKIFSRLTSIHNFIKCFKCLFLHMFDKIPEFLYLSRDVSQQFYTIHKESSSGSINKFNLSIFSFVSLQPTI